jgi:PAS domain S-box-containing protein
MHTQLLFYRATLKSITNSSGQLIDYRVVDVDCNIKNLFKCTIDTFKGRKLSEIFSLIDGGKEGVTNQNIRFQNFGIEPTKIYCKALSKHFVLQINPNGRDLTPAYFVEVNFKKDKKRRPRKVSNDPFWQVFHNHSMAQLIVNPDSGNIIHANRAASDFFGWTIDELQSKELHDICLINTFSKQRKKQSILSGNDSKVELILQRANGKSCKIELIATGLYIQNKKYVHVIIHEIPVLKEPQQHLVKNDKILNTMIEASPVAIYRLSPDGFVQSWNMAAERMFGWNAAEVIGKKLPIVPSDKQEEFDNLRESVIKKGALESLELERRRKDGSVVYISLSTASIINESGEVEAILSIASDITDRKEKEEQISLQHKALNSAANAIVITDKDGKIEWINSAWTELTGYGPNEVLGENPKILKSGLQDEKFYQELWDTILKGEFWTGELINKRRDGTLYHEFQTITPLMDDNGSVSRFIAIKQDITKQKEIEKRLRDLLQEKNILITEIHHRVKNNLALLSAIMYLETMQCKNKDLADYIHKNIHRIATISSVHELVYSSENWSKVNLEKVLTKIVDSTGRISNEGSQIELETSAEPILINVNQALPASLIINEIVMNLYRSYSKYNIKRRIQVKASEKHSEIRISITELGRSVIIDRHELNEILGLQLVNTLTKQLDGALEISRTEEQSSLELIFERDDSASGASNGLL